MTREEAITRARELFGKPGDAIRFPDMLTCRVGVWERGEFATRGEGKTWEEALANVVARAE